MTKKETEGSHARYEKSCSDWQYEQRKIAERGRDALAARVKELEAILSGKTWSCEMCKPRAELEAENTRLRKTLEEIRLICEVHPAFSPQWEFEKPHLVGIKIGDIAKSALEETK